jgi:hypothetical protein
LSSVEQPCSGRSAGKRKAKDRPRGGGDGRSCHDQSRPNQTLEIRRRIIPMTTARRIDSQVRQLKAVGRCDCALPRNGSSSSSLGSIAGNVLEISMLNPWLSLSLHTAQLALKMTQIMTGVVPNSTGSSHISESDDRAVPQVRSVTGEQAAVAEVKNRPMVAAAEDISRRSRTKWPVRKTPSRTKVADTPKEAAPRRAAAKAVPKVAAPKPAAKRRGAASLARAKATRRSAKKK